MSFPANTTKQQQKPMTTLKHIWAWEQATGSSSAKLVLLALARHANDQLLAYPSIACLSTETELDRKTVMRMLKKLLVLELIKDTGFKKGSTNQVTVYKLEISSDFIDKHNSTKNVTINSTYFGTVTDETVPNFPDNSTKFPSKQSQKRYTEELLNNKEEDNNPPIVPPQGDVSDSSLASKSIELAETVIEPVEPESKPMQSEPKPTKQRKKAEQTPAYVLEQFECFWKTMPLRKVGKDLALRAFVKTTAGKTEAEVIRGTTGLLADLAKRFKHIEGYDSSYRLLHPATYLNQRRWTDEDMPERKGKLADEVKPDVLSLPHFDLSDGGTALQKWAVKQGFRAAKGKETAWDYLAAIKALVTEKNGGAA